MATESLGLLGHPFCSPPLVQHFSGFNKSASFMDINGRWCQSERRRLQAVIKCHNKQLLSWLTPMGKVYLVCWAAIVTRFHRELLHPLWQQFLWVLAVLPHYGYHRWAIQQHNWATSTFLQASDWPEWPGYLTASCFSVRFTLPDSWHTVLHADKISSIYHWRVHWFIFLIHTLKMYAMEKGNGEIFHRGWKKKSLLLTCLLWHVDQGFSWTWMVGNISNEIFHTSLRFFLHFQPGNESISSIYKVKAPPNRNLEGDSISTTFKWSNLRSLIDKNLFRLRKFCARLPSLFFW